MSCRLLALGAQAMFLIAIDNSIEECSVAQFGVSRLLSCLCFLTECDLFVISIRILLLWAGI